MAVNAKHPLKEGLIGLEAAADYLECSHQYLGKILNNEDEHHPLADYFRHYAGRWRTTYALLDEYFTTGSISSVRSLPSEKEISNAHKEPAE
jgi:hypothetical protein